MKIYEKVCRIYNEHLQDLHRSKEQQFIEDMYEGLDGLGNISDDDITEYLTPRQIAWINDIAVALNI